MEAHYFLGSAVGNDEHFSYFDLSIDGHSYKWCSLGGVFSCKRPDRGGALLLKVLLDAEIEGGEVLDLGCGHGSVGLPLAALRPELEVLLTDINLRAVYSAHRNKEALSLQNAKVVVSDALSAIKSTCGFNAVALNPPVRAGLAIVHRLADEAWQHLLPGGALFIVLRVKQGALRFLKRCCECYDKDAEVVLRKKGYLVIEARKGEG